ncbi:MAG: hypothetical protein CVU39_16620 [Chloroflexi bacterium HGW-Chloroflexi-10]|nr:MAG: hypothetical protein CVU39_16620 [Chloroflexi bacterium HGW-Chloroflexi-10]
MTIHGPTPLELLRQVPQILHSPVKYLDYATRTYGDMVYFRAGKVNAFLLNHPEAALRVLRDHHSQYNKDTMQYNALARITGRGLLTNSGEHWLQQRRLIQPAFARQKLEAIEPFAVAAANRTIQRWHRQAQTAVEPIIDMEHEMMLLSLDVLGNALFGSDLSEQLTPLVEATLTALKHIMAGAKNPLQAPVWLPTAANRRFERSLHTLDMAVAAMLAERLRKGLGEDLLSVLIRAQQERGKEDLPDRQVRDEIVTLLIAGHETVATALTWSWYLLDANSEKRNILNEEVDSVLGKGIGFELSHVQLEALPYTLQVFQEALRLYPPAWLITRKALQADEVRGLAIPEKSLVIISPYTMHRHPAFWPDAERFEPQRFDPERTREQHKFAYIPFGVGPALCIGKNFALIEAQIILAMLSRHFSFERVYAASPVEMDALVTLRPRDGMPMRLVARS